MSGAFRVVEDDLSGPEVQALLHLHLDEMRQWSPPESVHAMPVERLRAADVTFVAAWDDAGEGPRIAACGALRHLDDGHGEIKSMRAHPDYRGRGAGRAILDHLISEARSRGYLRLSLETGSPDAFLPARRLYAANGFAECGPFAEYVFDPFSVYMTREL